MQTCVVRDLKSAAATPLSDAFRAHLSPDVLDNLHLRIGDICDIATEDGKCTGVAIAWRAADKLGSPKNPPVKLSEILREAYGFKLGAPVIVKKSSAKITTADKIVLTEVTGVDNEVSQSLEDGCWISRSRTTLVACNCEAFAANMSFDVPAKLKGQGPKKRFMITSVEPRPPATYPGLYNCTDCSEIVFQDEATAPLTPLSDSTLSFQPHLESTRIGGLVEQVKYLNNRLAALVSDVRTSNRPQQHILLHGPSGTGKTLLLRELSRLPFRKVLKPSHSILRANTGKSEATIRDLFKDAAEHQPSLILIDNIDTITSPEDIFPEDVYDECFHLIEQKRVLVVAATRDHLRVHGALLQPGMLTKTLFLPVPDVQQRAEILRLALVDYDSMDEDIVAKVAAQTHGFTGRDLLLLVIAAMDNAETRIQEEQRAWSDGFCQEHASPSVGEAAQKVTGTQATIKMVDIEVALRTVRPSALREVIFEPPDVSWEDIGGSSEMKRRFDKIIGWPLHYPDLMTTFRMKAKNGVLLYGPPGCSKTMTAQAVATTYGLNFIAVKGAELVSSYVGESERAIRDVFTKAKAAQPCVIFFDEIDSIASERASDGQKGLNLVTTLLTEMDGFETLKGVYVLAATNKPHALDKALMRPGRFDQRVYVKPPTQAARRDILQIQLGSLPVHDEALDLDGTSHKTNGYSGADMVQLCAAAKELAFERAISDGKVGISMRDLESAFEETKSSITDGMLLAYEKFASGDTIV
ncbi:AAA-domain-containing protein [Polychaeton citri CBS 116435]|uniref:AAA-domain-containing protein n=1 Tax=Polychaeton citri CBS 116435 TaxID=1314669 RepID=A0A9P4USK1_9PEZI|nr:AAA-domain-containing protein [Polychaeton citri CBS 116435]